ncbi:hypothetical protein P5V15_015612 [Pogonomyrmex californicus]
MRYDGVAVGKKIGSHAFQLLLFRDVEDSIQIFSEDGRQNIRKWLQEFEEAAEICGWSTKSEKEAGEVTRKNQHAKIQEEKLRQLRREKSRGRKLLLKEKGTKCFQCSQFGHIAAKCSKKENNSLNKSETNTADITNDVPEIFRIEVAENKDEVQHRVNVDNIDDCKLRYRIKKAVDEYSPQAIKQLGIKLDLILKDDIPDRPHRLVPKEKEIVNEHISEWLQADIVRPTYLNTPCCINKKKIVVRASM